MIIQSSSIGMNSNRRYASSAGTIMSLSVWGQGSGRANTMSANASNPVAGILQEREKNLPSGSNQDFTNRLKEQLSIHPSRIKTDNNPDLIQAYKTMRQQTVDYLFELLFGKNRRVQSNPLYGSLSEQSSAYANDQASIFGGELLTTNYYAETESTTFQTTGTVVTGDGKSIQFNLNLNMTRSFMKASSEAIQFGAPRMIDPLVINLDQKGITVTDQTFTFDLDADGHDETLSRLGAGSGFLALDKNGDGKINDGNELFGTKSGNGFQDLAAYDSDGNGWIDEADAIFEKLLIWQTDANGKETLIGLGKAGVGAIYLGSEDTEFSFKETLTNATKATIRQSGVFLYENGGVGTIQQMDYAT